MHTVLGKLTSQFCQRLACGNVIRYNEHDMYIHNKCAPLFRLTEPWNEIPSYSCAREYKCGKYLRKIKQNIKWIMRIH